MGFHYCSLNINDYVFSRQCFMTGEYCSKQLNIQRERQRLYRDGEINAFVVMSFTDMTDVMYEWRIQSYIKSLAKNLYFVSPKEISAEQFAAAFDPVDTEISKELLSNVDQNNDNQVETNRAFSQYLQKVSQKEKLLKTSGEELKMRFKDGSPLLLYCYANEEAHLKKIQDDLRSEKYYPEYKVKEINVIRADSNPSSNFVICNRVCQQMQIADLVVVDVSDENTNVFYELGMAMAFQKLILPICYSESYFAKVLPEGVKAEKTERLKRMRDNDKNNAGGKNADYNNIVEDIEQHIDCYPWQRQLFEHFGMRYKKNQKPNDGNADQNGDNNQIIRYQEYETVTSRALFNFSDLKYARFPYNRIIYLDKQDREESVKPTGSGSETTNGKAIGKLLYDHLRDSFNYATNADNTLVVYTMDSILNSDEGGQCIVNYYRAYVKRMKAENCFCGDRVGLLIQSTAIAEPVKDAEERRHLLYNIGEIIRIGMNQATYLAHKEVIKPKEYLDFPENKNDEKPTTDLRNGETIQHRNCSDTELRIKGLREEQLKYWEESFRRFAKEYISNRSFPIFPRDPVYVDRVNLVHQDLFNNSIENLRHDPDINSDEYRRNDENKDNVDVFFCLYQVMLRNLKYVSEIAVDVSNNSVQSLFWLGAAHASGVYAITIRHDRTEQEKRNLVSAGEERGQQFRIEAGRNIFDLSGLWTAVLHAYDTRRFYTQLEQVQKGIEQRSKLLHWSSGMLEDQMKDDFWKPDAMFEAEKSFKDTSDDTYRERKNRESELLESYYRNRFWRPMLRRNQLEIYACQDDLTLDKVKVPGLSRSYVPAWDVEAISTFSKYLSKRKMIGNYHFSLEPRTEQSQAQVKHKERRSLADLEKTNYICVGAHVNPYSGEMLRSYLNCNLLRKGYNPQFCELTNINNEPPKRSKKVSMRKCAFSNGNDFTLQAWFPTNSRATNYAEISGEEAITYNNCAAPSASIGKAGLHYQLGQLLLWREYPGKVPGKDVVREPYSFRASLVGTSGPATCALSTLFVDEIEKEELLFDYKSSYAAWKCGNHNDCPQKTNSEDPLPDKKHECPLKAEEVKVCPWGNNRAGSPEDLPAPALFPLTTLQEEIRGVIIAKYSELLSINLNKINAITWGEQNPPEKKEQGEKDNQDEKRDYITRIISAATLYLSTVLYRRFFPFLSHEDEARICNGLDLFIRKAMANSISPFSLAYKSKEEAQKKVLAFSEYSAIILNDGVEQSAKITVETLETLLDSLQAVEVFYKVLVDFHKDEDRKITERRIRRIELVRRRSDLEKSDNKQGEESKEYLIRCIFKRLQETEGSAQ